MKTRWMLKLICIVFVTHSFAQSTFQKNIGVSNSHYHDLNIEPMNDNSNDYIVAGNLFDGSMQNEQLTIKRVAATGGVLWVNTYNHPSYQLIRGFDVAINGNLIVATGSVDVNGIKKVFVITIDALTGILQNGMYYNIVDPLLNSRGLHIVYTESDLDGDSIPDPGYLVGGFYSDCYAVDPTCVNLGFLIRTDIKIGRASCRERV